MCGRITIPDSEILMRDFHLKDLPSTRARYNAAPSQNLICLTAPHIAQSFEWGFLPSWAKDTKTLKPQINARSETVAEKPFYKSSFLNNRCLVPVSGFYEWKVTDGKKIPTYIKLQNKESFALAGIWSDAKTLNKRTVAILTTEPNSLMASIHNRMPVILDPESYKLWLNADTQASELLKLLRPFNAEKMQAHSVSPFVNSPKNDSAECIAKV